MDPISLSLSIAPLVFSSAKLLATVGSIRQIYKNAQTAVTNTQTECDLMHVALCEVQGLVHRNNVELAVRLRSQRSLEETFDNVLTGCRLTLDALTLELDGLLKATKDTKSGSGNIDRLSKVHDTQAEILKLVQENASSVQKLLNKAKSIRSLQGFDDTQSIFTSIAAFTQDLSKGSYEEQLHQSPAYRKAQTAAAEELFAAKLELLEEKYVLEETLDSLRAELDLKDEAFSALNRVVRAKAQEIQDLQQANESLETCVRQLNRDLEALKEYSKSKEPVKIQLNSEGVLLVQRGHADSHTTPVKPSPNKTALDQEFSQEKKELVLEKLRSNGFQWVAKLALYWAAFDGKLGHFRVENYSADFKAKMEYLNAALVYGHVEVVEYIWKNQSKWQELRFKLNAETREMNDLDALQLASETGNIAVVEELISAGANVNTPAPGWKGRTALQAAAGGGHIDVVEALLDTGADVNAYFRSRPSELNHEDYQWNAVSALQAATAGGHADVAQKMLIAGALIPDFAALSSAVHYGHLELVDILLKSGGDWTGDSKILASAVLNGRLDILRTLLNGNFSVTNNHLFELSVLSGNIQMLQALIDARAVKGSLEFRRSAALEIVAVAGLNMQTFQDLRAAKCSLGFLGSVALKAAAAAENLQMIDALLTGNHACVLRKLLLRLWTWQLIREIWRSWSDSLYPPLR